MRLQTILKMTSVGHLPKAFNSWFFESIANLPTAMSELQYFGQGAPADLIFLISRISYFSSRQ